MRTTMKTTTTTTTRPERRPITVTTVLSVITTVSSIVLLLSTMVSVVDGVRRKQSPYTEQERRMEYIKRGHTFPLKEYTPDTPGWRRLMDQRFTQVQALTDSQMKWDGWLQTMNSAVTMPNFTEYGWGLTQAPSSLTEDIRQAIYEGLPTARSEGEVDVIDGPEQPLFIDRPDMTSRALKELQPILEAWSGIELVPSIAYGFRVYRNESSLWMHVDRTQTHVISCIYHIASGEESEPWPIVIEDYDGNTNSVILKPGDLLLYESAKNFHGRPTKFNGDWYTSLFVHFYPKGDWDRENHDLDAHWWVPPNWADVIPDDVYPALEVVGTSLLEPDCASSWCHLLNAVELEGPGEYGTVLTTNGKRYSLNLEDGEEDEF